MPTQQQLAEMYAWYQARIVQQISNPLDDPSRNLLQVPTFIAAGSATLTQSVSVPSTPTNITVPAAFSGTVLLLLDGTQREVPYL